MRDLLLLCCAFIALYTIFFLYGRINVMKERFEKEQRKFKQDLDVLNKEVGIAGQEIRQYRGISSQRGELVRSMSKDIDKLRKKNEILKAENEHLQYLRSKKFAKMSNRIRRHLMKTV